MTYLRRSVLVTLVLFVSAILNSRDARAQQRLDATYISSDTALVIIAHPQQIFRRESKVAGFRQQMLSIFQLVTGMDAKNIRQVVFQFSGEMSRVADGGGFDFSKDVQAVVRFDKPIEEDPILARVFSDNSKTTYKSKAYYKPNSEDGVALWFPDGRTMILGPETRVRRLIDEPSSMGLMVSRLAEADASCDLLVEVDVRRARTILQEVFANAPAEEPFAVKPAIDKLTRVTLIGKLTSDTPLELRLVATTEKNADYLNRKALALLGLAKPAWPKARLEIMEHAPDQMAEGVVEIVEAILNGTKIVVNEKQVSMLVQKKGGLPEVFNMLLGTMMIGSDGVNKKPEKADLKDLKKESEKAVPRFPMEQR